jgi:hypothetical protein
MTNFLLILAYWATCGPVWRVTPGRPLPKWNSAEIERGTGYRDR